jgi:integrase
MTEYRDYWQASLADKLRAQLLSLPLDERQKTIAQYEALTIDVTPPAGADWVKQAVQHALSETKKSLSPDSATPRKCTAKDINRLVEQIRSGQPPELPKGKKGKRKREVHYRDPTLPNLYIRLYDTGTASWVVQWKKLGRQGKKEIGDVLVIDRVDAIKAARELLAKITLDMLDPHKAKRERMRANKVTFATLVPLFLEDKIYLRPSTASHWKRYLTGYYLQPLHSLPIDEITKEQIQTRIGHIATQSGKRAAEKCCGVLRVFFKWAIKTGNLPEGHHNPLTNVQPPKQNAPRERVLTNDEIQLIWNACEAWEAQAIREEQFKKSTGKPLRSGIPNSPNVPRIIKLLFLTGCRAQEIGDLQWSEIDLDNGELLIPGARTKNAIDLCNPLADWAVQILRGIARRPNDDHVFGRGRGQLNQGGKRINKWIERTGGTPPKGWTLHDIRRTFRTRLAALGVTDDIGERLLGHVGHNATIKRTYNRHKYWAEKRQALAMYEDHLRAVIDGTAEKFAHPNFGQRREGNPA